MLCPQLEAIGQLSDDMRRHFRTKLRNLFTKFIRKFGSVRIVGQGRPGLKHSHSGQLSPWAGGPLSSFFSAIYRFELVKGLLPEEYHRVLVNIKKAEARAKRHRALSQAAEEEEEEEEEEPAQGKGDR